MRTLKDLLKQIDAHSHMENQVNRWLQIQMDTGVLNWQIEYHQVNEAMVDCQVKQHVTFLHFL